MVSATALHSAGLSGSREPIERAVNGCRLLAANAGRARHDAANCGLSNLAAIERELSGIDAWRKWVITYGMDGRGHGDAIDRNDHARNVFDIGSHVSPN